MVVEYVAEVVVDCSSGIECIELWNCYHKISSLRFPKQYQQQLS